MYLLLLQASLEELNRRLQPGEPLPMDRFRPNIVVSLWLYVHCTHISTCVCTHS